MMRYLVFSYASYYPEGGMNDCILKTDDRDAAIAEALQERDVWFNHASVYDTQTGDHISLPDCDVNDKSTPREEFEEIFGTVTDEQWHQLKLFTERHYDIRSWLSGVVGFRNVHTKDVYHPDDIEILR